MVMVVIQQASRRSVSCKISSSSSRVGNSNVVVVIVIVIDQ